MPHCYAQEFLFCNLKVKLLREQLIGERHASEHGTEPMRHATVRAEHFNINRMLAPDPITRPALAINDKPLIAQIVGALLRAQMSEQEPLGALFGLFLDQPAALTLATHERLARPAALDRVALRIFMQAR